MTQNAWFDAIEATWPAQASEEVAGFAVKFSQGGGSRVRAATHLGQPVNEGMIDRVTERQRKAGQPALFCIRPGEDAVDALLGRAGFARKDPTLIYSGPAKTLAQNAPPVTVFPTWPPLAIQEELWAEGGIGADRLAIMHRAAVPKISLFGRINDRPAGTVFVARRGGVAMLHALEITPTHRQQGLGRILVHAAAAWAHSQGAEHLALLVTRANVAANALYTSMGFQAVGHYHYRSKEV